MARYALLLLAMLSIFVTLSSASSAPVFCKCTCNKNSTIIPLDPNASPDPSLFLLPRDDSDLTPKAGSSSTCSQCTKAFCLGQGLDICKDAEEDDVVTLCFKRDSIKDRIIVWGFIVGTVGLLGWAFFKRFKSWREERRDTGYAAMPVGGR
ncbi:hypothetical protein LIA77_00636 [Sarocladium implicatum]|nr:hypothetical protein LIA77_00636 [Sarocladium implicatum]